jgi:Flp pilus assembly protein TadD
MLAALVLAALVARGVCYLRPDHPRLATRGAVAVAVLTVLALAAASGLRNRDWSSRHRLWEAAALAYPTSRSVLLYYAGALAEEGRPEDRLAVLQRAARLHPRDRRVRVFYAHALARADRPASAWRIARELAAEAPDDPEVLMLLGHLHRAAGDLALAAAAYAGALDADGASATARVYLADAQARLGHVEEARRVLAALSSHPRLSRGEAALLSDLRERLR